MGFTFKSSVMTMSSSGIGSLAAITESKLV